MIEELITHLLNLTILVSLTYYAYEFLYIDSLMQIKEYELNKRLTEYNNIQDLNYYQSCQKIRENGYGLEIKNQTNTCFRSEKYSKRFMIKKNDGMEVSLLV